VGWVIWREAADLPEEMVFWVNYLGGNMRDIALNFSRPGGQIVCQYYNFLRLGRDGYAKVHGNCYTTAQYLAGEVAALGPFEILYGGEPDLGIPTVCWKMKPGAAPGFSLYDLADRLRTRGWQVPAKRARRPNGRRYDVGAVGPRRHSRSRGAPRGRHPPRHPDDREGTGLPECDAGGRH
jgi:glutamate/tyrosine decarboxylase-like PLP-dependent enzyme